MLSSDLSGFTAIHDKLDPEEVRGRMLLKDRAVEIAEAQSGIVGQFMRMRLRPRSVFPRPTRTIR